MNRQKRCISIIVEELEGEAFVRAASELIKSLGVFI